MWSELKVNLLGTLRATPENRQDELVILMDYLAVRKMRGFMVLVEQRVSLAITRAQLRAQGALEVIGRPKTYADVLTHNRESRTRQQIDLDDLPQDRLDSLRRQLHACARDLRTIEIALMKDRGSKVRQKNMRDKVRLYERMGKLLDEANAELPSGEVWTVASIKHDLTCTNPDSHALITDVEGLPAALDEVVQALNEGKVGNTT